MCACNEPNIDWSHRNLQEKQTFPQIHAFSEVLLRSIQHDIFTITTERLNTSGHNSPPPLSSRKSAVSLVQGGGGTERPTV